MTESSKTKLWWFAGLFVRLLLITILWVFLTFISITSISSYIIKTRSFYIDYLLGFFWSVQTILLLTGYTCIIYRRLRLTGVMRLLASIALGILATGFAYVFFYVLFIALAIIFNFTLAS
jgi:hypothetical protein